MIAEPKSDFGHLVVLTSPTARRILVRTNSATEPGRWMREGGLYINPWSIAARTFKDSDSLITLPRCEPLNFIPGAPTFGDVVKIESLEAIFVGHDCWALNHSEANEDVVTRKDLCRIIAEERDSLVVL